MITKKKCVKIVERRLLILSHHASLGAYEAEEISLFNYGMLLGISQEQLCQNILTALSIRLFYL